MPNASQQLDECLRRIADRKARLFERRVAAATPVDTGRAQRGWNRIAGPNGGQIVSNEVPYIDELNAGSSRQAPSMFVQRALRRTLRERTGG